MYLGVDLWDKKVWLAVELEGVVIPKEIVKRVEIINRIKYYISKYDIKVIVVWLPYDLYNKDLRQLNKTKKFIDKLEWIFPDHEVVWFDERFTTFWAKETFISEKDRWLPKDDISASLVLEGYLKSKGV